MNKLNSKNLYESNNQYCYPLKMYKELFDMFNIGGMVQDENGIWYEIVDYSNVTVFLRKVVL